MISNGNITSIIEACKQLGIKYKQVAPNFVEVQLNRNYYFVNASTPVDPSPIVEIAKDKDFTYKLLEDTVAMPKTLSFIDPYIEKRFQKYVCEVNYPDILNQIQQNLSLPIIIKRNRGEHGIHVFKCVSNAEVKKAISRIFDHK